MSFQEIIGLLTAYKYFFLFPVSIIEGPIITVLAGFLSSLGLLNLFFAYVAVVAGDIVGDSLYYLLGYYGKDGFLLRGWGRSLGITKERLEQLEKHFEKHSGKTLIIGKLTHAVGIVALIAAGTARVPFWKFIWYNVIPTIPKSLVFLLIGYYFGKTYAKVNTYLDYTALITIAITIILIATYFIVRNIGKKYENQDIV
jgi:membrane protein DedA with SNARE-associated domain